MDTTSELAFGPENHGIAEDLVRDRVKRVAAQLKLEPLLDRSIFSLSGGEKQKLSIVRSLSKDSSLILLDEPTSALDQKSITTLIEYLELRKQQAIIVIVSHDSRILSSCDELVEMR